MGGGETGDSPKDVFNNLIHLNCTPAFLLLLFIDSLNL